MPAPMPAAEVEVDAALVRRLLRAQFPEWAALPLRRTPGIGWDNVVYRLGDDLAVRLPRRALAARLVEKEHRWLPELARHLPVPVPAPLALGGPGGGYPWAWTVCPWIPGRRAATNPVRDRRRLAEDLGRFVAALHRPGPADGPANPYRAVPLAARHRSTTGYLKVVGDLVDGRSARRVWRAALDAPPWEGPPVWIHGDLHPANMLVAGGHLAGVIDFGDLAVGDPAVDLVSGWMLLDATARPVFRRAAGADAATWDRARGWALSIGLACLAHSADNEVVGAMGRVAVREVLADPDVPGA